MTRISRRDVIKSAAAGLLCGVHTPLLHGQGRSAGPNSEVRVSVIGLGGIDIEGSVGGRGRQLIDALQNVSRAKIVSICDVDEHVLGHGVDLLSKRNQKVRAHRDMREVFDDKNVDAVLIATPNHWHALATVWACQAGKDVYVEKPFSHDIWEGKQMVAAAREHQRMVQVGTQSRSSGLLKDAFTALHAGELGAMRSAHAIIYRPRPGIGTVNSPTPIPSTVNYNLWSGPIPQEPLMRPHLHYEWHWFWDSGNGEIGNNGPHTIDVARWALGQNKGPSRVLSIAGRFDSGDQAETPNTHLAFMDYQPVPLVCEVRNLGSRRDGSVGNYRGTGGGAVIDCEGGYCIANSSKATFYDRNGRETRVFDQEEAKDIVPVHLENFVAAVESRDLESLNAEAIEGHHSALCFHMANVSHRLGKTASPQQIREAAATSPLLLDAFDRCQQHLQENGVRLSEDKATLGSWVTLDTEREVFVSDHAEQANALSRKEYRAPFVVPELTS